MNNCENKNIKKESYEYPDMLIMTFQSPDILTTSDGLIDGGTNSGDGSNWGDWGV